MENRVKACREGMGWSQGELARSLGVSRQTINAVETDKYDPSLPLALRMAKSAWTSCSSITGTRRTRNECGRSER